MIPVLPLPQVFSTLVSSILSYDRVSTCHRAFAISLSVSKEPDSYAEAILDPRWQEVTQAEIDALKANNTWVMCPLPPGKVPIWCKWVYKVKLKANGSLKGIKLVWWLKGLHKLGELIFLRLFLLWLSLSPLGPYVLLL